LLALLLIGVGILIAGLTEWLQQGDAFDTQGRYQSAILFAVSGLFIYPVLAKVSLGMLLYAYEGLLQWKRFSSLPGVQEIHLHLSIVFYQIVRCVYILLDLITFAILEALLFTASNEKLCSNISQCDIQIIRDVMTFIVRILIVLIIWSAFRIFSKSLKVHFSKQFNNRTHRVRINATLRDELMLQVLLHKLPNALLLPSPNIYGDSEKFIDASTTARASTYITNHLVDFEIGLRQGSDVEAYSKIISLRVFNRIFVNCRAEGFELLNLMTANGGHFLKKLKGQQNDKRVKPLVEKKDFIEYFDSSIDHLGGLTGLEVWNSLLDPDDLGILTSKKCITQIRRISESRKNTVIGMQDTDMVIRSLDFGIATGFDIIVVLIGIGVIGIDVSSAWTMISSVVLSLTFICGAS